ncbi:SGNH hydrolase [Actinoplanes sp. OR16]|uniref:SGNH/GDSL hydrolase family protein n=1 Tax=Actinoplanes sp. OR16 TaxID=946334 RepID=UPI000F7207C6|nr:SGNH/GDSL hydrolase family protein [Actinoplanes sp. OR16]BBH69403.1 SGNH hydrolase [Actinoplanes sp. OR16]
MTALTELTDPDVLIPQAAARILADAPWRRFAVFGDSLSLGVGDPTPGYDSLGWADRMARVLRQVQPGLAYLNTARVGATTAQAQAEQAERITGFAPDLLHLNSGANDIMRRRPDWTRIEDDLRAMYVWAASTGARLSVFTLGRAFVVPAFPDFTDRVARLNDITRRRAAEYDAVVADCWDHRLNDRPNLLSGDRIHFATVGQAAIATLMVRALGARLGERDERRGW